MRHLLSGSEGFLLLDQLEYDAEVGVEGRPKVVRGLSEVRSAYARFWSAAKNKALLEDLRHLTKMLHCILTMCATGEPSSMISSGSKSRLELRALTFSQSWRLCLKTCFWTLKASICRALCTLQAASSGSLCLLSLQSLRAVASLLSNPIPSGSKPLFHAFTLKTSQAL